MDNINNVKAFIKSRLNASVNSFLSRNYDWKVTKSITTGEPIAPADIQFRSSVIAEYNMRVAAVESATTLEELNKISLTF